MWKTRAAARIAIDVVRNLCSPAAQCGLYVDQIAVILGRCLIHIAVTNPGDRTAQSLLLRRVGENVNLLEDDVDSKIDADLANRVAQIFKGEGAILTGVTDDNLAAAPH